jgi:isoleucyl-tRNA synthetase
MAPIAPFYADLLFSDLNTITGKENVQSVHLADFPSFSPEMIDAGLEEKMAIAQQASSMILALRRKEKLKVRQPLSKIMVPVLNSHFKEQFDAVKNIILAEVNVKEVEYLYDSAEIIKKKIKPNFKTLGPKFGPLMKQIAGAIAGFKQSDISELERTGSFEIKAGEQIVVLGIEDVEITTEDIPGWTVATEGTLTIALDINLTEELKQEGIAREFINKIQNIRKESDFSVTDRIKLKILKNDAVNDAIINFKDYISNQTLAVELILVDRLDDNQSKLVEVDAEVETLVSVEKFSQE